MKKLLAFVLALGLAVSTSVTAFAEDAATTETNDSTKSTEIAVNGSYQAATPAGSSISVDVVWEDMSFTYTGESQGAWDPKTHSYGDTIPAHWAWSKATEEKTAPNITLTNHSDTGVKAKFAFNSPIVGLTGTFTDTDGNTLTDNALTLPTALKTDPDKAPSAVTAFSIGGGGIDKDQQLGSIIVTVAKDGATGGDADVTEVSDTDTLDAAIRGNKASIRVTENFVVTYPIYVSGYNGTLDLDNHTLTRGDSFSSEILSVSSSMTIKNGSFADTNYSNTYQSRTASLLLVSPNGNVTLEKCKIESDEVVPLYINAGTALLKDCTITSAKIAAYGTLIFSGNTMITDTENGINKEDGSTVTCLAGTYNFDPTVYVDTNKYTVTDDGNGTWTVAEGTTGGDTTTDQVTVTTFEELEDAIRNAQSGKTITLGKNIETNQQLVLQSSANIVIDFAGHTLTSSANTAISNRSNLTLKNGTLAGTGATTTLITDDNSSLIAEGMTITSEKSYALNPMRSVKAELTNCTLTTKSTNTAAVFLQKADATLNNCTVESKSVNAILLTGGFADSSDATGATLTISGGTTVNDKIKIDSDSVPCTIVVQEGCSFNPADHYDSSNATLTNNNDGTWTITAGTTGGDTTEA